MALETKVKETVQIDFKEVGKTGVFVSQTDADHKNSLSILQQYGLEPLTYQEAIARINQHEQLKEQLKYTMFYLDGKCYLLPGFNTVDHNGELTPGKRDIERTVFVNPGQQPLVLRVHADYDALFRKSRFNLYADGSPDEVAHVVVGVQAGHKMTMPKVEALNGSEIDPELISEFKSVIDKMDAAAQAGGLNAEITEVAKKVLRAIEKEYQ